MNDRPTFCCKTFLAGIIEGSIMSGISIVKALEMAMEQHQSGHFQRAQDLYLSILEQDPGNVDAIHLLGVLAHQGKRSDLAIEYIERAISQRPDEPVFHFNYADCLAAVGRTADAIQSLKTATVLAPDYYNAWYGLAYLANQSGDFPEALRAGNEAYELAENPAASLILIGLANRALGNYVEAVKNFEEAIVEDPMMPEAYTNLGTALSNNREIDKAIPLFLKAIELRPNFADAHNNLGVAYLKKQDFENAAKHLNLTLQLKPDFADAYNNLGVTLRDSGHPEESLSMYAKAIELKTDFAEAYNNYAQALMDLGRHEECIEKAKEALIIRPEFSEAYFNVAQANRTLGRLDEAATGFQKAMDLMPDASSPYTMLGYVLVERGEVDLGLTYINKWLALFDNPTGYGDMLLAVNYSDKISFF